MPEIQMPKLSDTMTEGTLVAWKKKKGDQVSAGEVLAEIETDKATMEWESPEDGTLTEIYVEEGGKVNVGDRIAFIGGEGEEAPKTTSEGRKRERAAGKRRGKREAEGRGSKKGRKARSAESGRERREKAPPLKAEKKEPEAEKRLQKIEKPQEARVKASPVARRIAAELGVDLSA